MKLKYSMKGLAICLTICCAVAATTAYCLHETIPAAMVSREFEGRGAFIRFELHFDGRPFTAPYGGKADLPVDEISDVPLAARAFGPHFASRVAAIGLSGPEFCTADVEKLSLFRQAGWIDLEEIFLSKAAFRQLCDLPHLEVLILTECTIERGGMDEMQGFSSLKTIVFTDCQFENTNDFACLGDIPSLGLIIATNSVDDEAVRSLMTRPCTGLGAVLLNGKNVSVGVREAFDKWLEQKRQSRRDNSMVSRALYTS